MITIDQVSISYGKDKKVIDSLNLTISEGTINGLVGLNGAGKTTLFNAIFGLKSLDAGKIEYQDDKLSKKVASYLVTEPFFYSNITGEEYLRLFRNAHFDTAKWNQLFQLPLHQIIDDYSNGMKKKLAFLSILKQDKPIIILDEPFNGLDIEACRIVRSIILGLKEKGKTILLSSHIIETLTNLCDFIHYLEGGRIKYSKEKSEFMEFEKQLLESLKNKNKSIIAALLE
jgi:ABC-2 type transport system ATP-binding protein